MFETFTIFPTRTSTLKHRYARSTNSSRGMQCLKWKSFEHTTCDFRLKLLKWNNQNVSEEKNVIVKTKLSATSREFRPGQGMMTTSQPPTKSIALYQLLVADYSSKSHVKDVPFYPNRTCGWLVHELSTSCYSL